jgi:hypothetical protein
MCNSVPLYVLKLLFAMPFTYDCRQRMDSAAVSYHADLPSQLMDKINEKIFVFENFTPFRELQLMEVLI